MFEDYCVHFSIRWGHVSSLGRPVLGYLAFQSVYTTDLINFSWGSL